MSYDINITNKKKPEGLTGTESFTVEDIDLKIFKATLQDIADLASSTPFALTNGNGTTANGTAIDLGGTMVAHAIFLNQGTYNFRIENIYNANTIQLNRDSFYSYFESGNLNSFINQDYNDVDIYLQDTVAGFASELTMGVTATIGDAKLGVQDGVNEASLSFHTNNGTIFLDSVGLGLFMPDIKSGINQGAAGAATNELWVDTSAANVIKRGV